MFGFFFAAMGFLDKYQTYRRVNVEGGIGRFYYISLLAIVLVIILHMCGTNKSHLYFEDELDGAVWARLRQPPKGDLQCSPDTVGAICDYWDWLESFESGASETFITTFVQEKLQRRACPRMNASCSQNMWQDDGEIEFYVASPEDFELVLEHHIIENVQNKHFEIHSSHAEGILLPNDYPPMAFTPTGLLYEPSHALKTFPNGTRDVTPLRELLGAAGVSLTDPVCESCGDQSIQGLGRSLRRWGVHLDVTLVYSNMWYNLCPWFRTGPARYAYIVRYVPMPEGVRIIKTLPSSPYFPETAGNGETRVVRRSYGIEIHYHQAGLLGVSSGVSILAFIIGSITLLGVPWTLSEFYVSLAPLLTPPKWYAAVVTDEATALKEKDQ